MSIYDYVERKASGKQINKTLREYHTPVGLFELIGRKHESDTIVSWLESFKYSKRTSNMHRYLMVSGPSGVGKTLLIQLAVKYCGMYVVDLHQDCMKSRREIQDSLTTCNKNYVALFEEFDFMEGISAADAKAIMEAYPDIAFVFIVNRFTHGKTFDLSKDALHVSLSPLGSKELHLWVHSIILHENMFTSLKTKDLSEIIEKVIHMSGGDMRFILNWLEFYHKGVNNSSATLVNPAQCLQDKHHKDEDINCIKATQLLLYSDDPITVKQALDLVNYDINLVTSMVAENYLSVASTHKKSKPGDLISKVADGAEMISLSDIVEQDMFNSQAWNAWEVFALFGAVYPSLHLRSANAKNPSFTKMWSVVSNMYYRFYRIDEIKAVLRKRGWSVDTDTLLATGRIIYAQMSSTGFDEHLKEYISLGLTADNINMLVRCGTLLEYKNTIQKKIKKEYDRVKLLDQAHNNAQPLETTISGKGKGKTSRLKQSRKKK